MCVDGERQNPRFLRSIYSVRSSFYSLLLRRRRRRLVTSPWHERPSGIPSQQFHDPTHQFPFPSLPLLITPQNLTNQSQTPPLPLPLPLPPSPWTTAGPGPPPAPWAPRAGSRSDRLGGLEYHWAAAWARLPGLRDPGAGGRPRPPGGGAVGMGCVSMNRAPRWMIVWSIGAFREKDRGGKGSTIHAPPCAAAAASPPAPAARRLHSRPRSPPAAPTSAGGCCFG